MKAAGKGLAMLLPVFLLAAAALAFFQPDWQTRLFPGSLGARLAAAPTPPAWPCAGARPPSPPYVGVAPAGRWRGSVARFVQATGVQPTIISQYVDFGSSFDAAQACQMAETGALLLVQMNPRRIPLADVAAGRYDGYLTRYAQAVKKYRLPVVFSFAHEMNGIWYPWGYTHTAPSVYIAAWRHIHTVFARAGASNVIWCWDPNGLILSKTDEAPARRWWPGRAYVNWVGLDAYFNHPDQTYATAIGASVAYVRTFTRLPVLVAETAVARAPQQVRQINSLFRGIRRARDVIGFVWFDHNRRLVWRIEGRPSALRAFHLGADSLIPVVRARISPRNG